MTSRLCFLFGLLCLFEKAFGHGAMYYPNPWWATSACSAENGPYGAGCTYINEVPTEEPRCTGKGDHWRSSGCSFTGGLTAWFTNYTAVPERTISTDEINETRDKSQMMIEWTDGVMVARDGPATKSLHPWNSPGSAPVHGGGCGANGGNPYGCIGNPDDKNGRCCGGAFKKKKGGQKWNQGCGGFANGKSALEWYKNGLFEAEGGAQVTTWEQGSQQTVIWQSSAYHRGGYAYRLCKVNDGKYWEVNEQCFKDGHLKFAGDQTWRYKVLDPTEPKVEIGVEGPHAWRPQELQRVTEGTNPPGSEWAWMDLDNDEVSDSVWAFQDLVQVPESLEPGQYVLSFRWDCQQSSQVWSSCANIEIV